MMHYILCIGCAALSRSRVAKLNFGPYRTDVYDLAGLGGVTAAQWAGGGLLTVLFTVLARGMRGVTTSGALAGAVCCFILYVGGGPGAFAALITVFGLTWATTRLGYQRKQELGIADGGGGRQASQ